MSTHYHDSDSDSDSFHFAYENVKETKTSCPEQTYALTNFFWGGGGWDSPGDLGEKGEKGNQGRPGIGEPGQPGLPGKDIIMNNQRPRLYVILHHLCIYCLMFHELH